jgi:hemerythrin-like metal-binding protein
MSLIQWKAEFSVGIPAVDHEHREMIALINDLHDELGRTGRSHDAVADFLGEINLRIGAHFALEEKEMRERHYDQLAQHKADHERLLDSIRDLMDRFEDDQGFDERALAQQLDEWFSAHFRSHDARLHRHLKHG